MKTVIILLGKQKKKLNKWEHVINYNTSRG
jgi:hypothetical protein